MKVSKLFLNTFFILWLLLSPALTIAQCPGGGRRPFFTSPTQLEKFKKKYPNCKNYDYKFYYENGVLMDRPKPYPGYYLLALSFILILILSALYVVSQKITFFK